MGILPSDLEPKNGDSGLEIDVLWASVLREVTSDHSVLNKPT